MSIRSLRSLISIADRGSFAAAANAERLSPSALSMQMRALEQELHMALFDRSKRPPVLSAAGRRLVEHARELVAQYDRLGSISLMESELGGTLIVGVLPTVSTGILPWALASLRQRYPHLWVRVVVNIGNELVARLERNEIDVAIIAKPVGRQIEDFAWQPFAEEGFVLISPVHPRGKSAHDLLRQWPYIRLKFPNRRAWTGAVIDGYLRQHQIAVRPVVELGSLEGIGVLVYSGLGVSIVPQRVIGSPLAVPVNRIPLPDPAPTRVLGIIHSKASPQGKLIQALLNELKNLSDAAVQLKAGKSSNLSGVLERKLMKVLANDI